MITKEKALVAADDLARIGGVTTKGIYNVLYEFIGRKPLIVAAALRFKNGLICSVPRPGRHHNVMHAGVDLGMGKPISRDLAEQGFLDADGQFLNRTEAMLRVIECKQPFKASGTPDSLELFSEDVW